MDRLQLEFGFEYKKVWLDWTIDGSATLCLFDTLFYWAVLASKRSLPPIFQKMLLLKSNQYHFLTFISLHWSIWSSTKGYTTLVQDTSLTQRGTFLILNFSTRSAAWHHRRCRQRHRRGATVAAVTPSLHTAPDHCCSVLHLTLDQFDSTAKGRSLAQYDNSRIFHMIFIQSFVIQNT